MTRLLIHVEGETEETFVNEVLAQYLCSCGYTTVSARLVGNARQRDRRGGIRPWNSVRNDILAHLKEDPGCVATTMVDYYALPQSGEGAWPNRERASDLPFHQKAIAIESAMHADICGALGSNFNPNRFIPYIMMHEFEGMLFSDCESFGRGICRTDLVSNFRAIRSQYNTPEEINDSSTTAPSKRIKNLVPNYEKPLLGALAVLEIGLDKIRDECPHFCEWLNKLNSGQLLQQP